MKKKLVTKVLAAILLIGAIPFSRANAETANAPYKYVDLAPSDANYWQTEWETQVYNYKMVRNFPTMYTEDAWKAAQNAGSLMMNIHPDAITDDNKEQILALALNGNELAKPADVIRDPYVFEFLGLPEDKPFLESDLEKALVQQIEKFLLELGRGFMFVGTQQRVTLNNTHYYVDMVFYNKILRAYVLIELKTTKLTPEAAGQINMYLNYYASEVNDLDDNPPIGIILCTEKDSITAEYALGGLSNNIFASRYVLYMPNKEQLIRQVEHVLKKWHKEE